ncbi:MAG: toxin-antitoxin system YwqK family antitoxin [Candidatus Binatia bacterium]
MRTAHLLSLVVIACGAACAAPRPVEVIPSALAAKVEYSADGLPNGSYKLYDATGRLYADGQFVGGRREGTWTFWDAASTKVVEMAYSGDRKNGRCRMWYGAFAYPKRAGNIRLDVPFSADQQHGTRRTWWPTGEPKCEAALQNGAVVDARCWGSDGKIRTAADSADTVRHELEADAKYLQMLDEVVRESVARDGRH